MQFLSKNPMWQLICINTIFTSTDIISAESSDHWEKRDSFWAFILFHVLYLHRRQDGYNIIFHNLKKNHSDETYFVRNFEPYDIHLN